MRPSRFLISILMLCCVVTSLRAQRIAPGLQRWITRNTSWLYIETFQKPPVNRFPVRVGGLWGYCDSTGTLTIQPQFTTAAVFENGIGVIQKNKKAYAIDTLGTILTPEGFDMLQPVTGDLLAYYDMHSEDDQRGGWGLITLSGKKILPAKYDEIRALSYGLIGYKQDSLWGFVNFYGLVLAEAQYDTAVLIRNGALMVVRNGKIGVVNAQGVRLVGDTCDDLYWMDNTVLAVQSKGLWGAVRGDGQQIVSCAWDTLLSANQYFLVAARGDSAKLFSPLLLQDISNGKHIGYRQADSLHMKCYSKEKKCGLIDASGKLILAEEYRDILAGGDGMWLLYLNKKWGAADSTGKKIAPVGYDLIRPFGHGVAIAFQGNLTALINKKGVLLFPLADQEIFFRGDMVKTRRKDGGAVFLTIDQNGNVLEKKDYAMLRTITIGGNSKLPNEVTDDNGWLKQPINFTTIVGSPPIQSDWFLDDNNLWGLRSLITGDTLIRPTFDFVQRSWSAVNSNNTRAYFVTIVGKRMDGSGPALDGKSTATNYVMGLVNDSSGAMILSMQYSNIVFSDLGWANIIRRVNVVRCTRAEDGATGIVTIDGSEQFSPYSFVNPADLYGRMRVCVGGKYVVRQRGTSDGEFMGTLSSFCYSNYINEKESFRGAGGYSESETKNSFVYLVGGKWGYLDKQGKVLIDPIYDAVAGVKYGTCIVRVEKNWGLVDSLGKMRIAPQFWRLRFSSNNDTLLIAEKYAPRYGYIDTLGVLVIPPGLKQSKIISSTLIAFNNAGKWGVCDFTGKVLLEEQFTDVLSFSEGRAAVRVGNKWGFIDSTCALVIAATYDGVGAFHEGLARVRIKSKWGFIDSNGTQTIEAKYDAASDFVGAAAPVKQKGMWLLINHAGEGLCKARYRELFSIDGSTNWAMREGAQYALANNVGKPLTLFLYDRFGTCTQGRIVVRKGLYWGVIDTLGAVKAACSLERVTSYTEGFMAVRWAQGWGYLDLDGHKLNTPFFRIAHPFSDGLALVVSEKNKAYFIDATGKKQFALTTPGVVSNFNEGIAQVSCYDRNITTTAYITRGGHRLGRMYFESGYAFSDGVAPVRLHGKWGLISFTGRFLVQPYFDGIEAYQYGVARCRQTSLYGMYTLNGTVFLPADYDYMESIDTRFMRINKGNAVGYIRPDGSWMWALQE